MVRLEMKNYNMILTEKQQKYPLYRQVKLINMKILPPNQRKLIKQAKSPYSSVAKSLENKTKIIEDQGKK